MERGGVVKETPVVLCKWDDGRDMTGGWTRVMVGPPKKRQDERDGTVIEADGNDAGIVAKSRLSKFLLCAVTQKRAACKLVVWRSGERIEVAWQCPARMGSGINRLTHEMIFDFTELLSEECNSSIKMAEPKKAMAQ
eukprot:764271-Hanusia_phi.AAC.1